ncbi:MAG: L,D-transpeptidase family protein [Myxococcota bacterium]
MAGGVALPVLLVASALAGEARVADVPLTVRASPSTKASRVGRIAPGAPFRVIGPAEGTGCGDPGWGELPDGFVCLAGTRTTDASPAPLPRLVTFDPPTPEEYRAYVRDGVWPREAGEPLLPYVYGKRWRRWQATTWASAEAYARGDAPKDTLEDDRKYHFVDVVDTPRGAVLVREDGRVSPLDDVFVYPVSRFRGVDLRAEPLPEGVAQAWVHVYDGAAVRAEPSSKAAVVTTLPHHAALRVTGEGRWLSLADGTGFVAAPLVRTVRPLPPPARVAGDELWIDVDLEEQVLMLVRGAVVEYATLVSTGLPPDATPPGIYRITDKSVDWDMQSLPDAPEPYHVERVPWVAHFRPRYALHGVFWHWGFGNRASHGCINLAPRDARVVFDAIAPRLPDGWHTVVATEASPGTTLRVRGDTVAVRDRR